MFLMGQADSSTIHFLVDNSILGIADIVKQLTI